MIQKQYPSPLCWQGLVLVALISACQEAPEATHESLRVVEQAAVPVAQDDTLSTDEDTPFEGQLSASDDDGDDLVFSIVDSGVLGTAVIDDEDTGEFTYTPLDNISGEDSFTFEVTDGESVSNRATVTVQINEINDAPQLQNNAGLNLPARTTATIDSDTLQVVDIDHLAAALTYTLSEAPDEGRLERGGALVGLGGTFTQADIDADTLSYIHTDNEGEDSFSFTVSDGAGGQIGETAFQIIIQENQPPVLDDLGGETQGDEGQSLTLVADATDPEGLPINFFWDFGDGDSVSGLGLSEVEHTYAQDGSQIVTVLVTDNAGQVDSSFMVVTVSNVAPTIDAGDNATVAQGAAHTFSGSADDPGDDVLTFCWDFGDNSNEVCGVDLTNPQHTYTLPNTYTVTLTVSDDDESVSDTVQITVQNIAPVANAGDDSASDEGAPFNFVGNVVDPGRDTLTLCWDFGDGSPQVCGVDLFSFSHTYADGPQTYTVTLTADDGEGGFDEDTRQHTVNNVNPSVQLGDDRTVRQGSEVDFTAQVADPGQDVLVYTWSIDCDDNAFPGCGDQSRFTSPSSGLDLDEVSALFSQTATYSLTLSVQDEDGGLGSDTILVEVANDLPDLLVTLGEDTIDEGDFASVTISASDPGEGTLILSLDFGDGQSEGDIAHDFPYPDVGRLHAYTQEGQYTLTATATDNNDEEIADSIVLTVNNVPPSIELPDAEGSEGSAISFSATVTDPGDDTLSYRWNFGDGSDEVTTDTPSVSHAYAQDGTYTLTLTANDGTDEASQSASVAIFNVRPQVVLAADDGIESVPLSFSAAATDPGDDVLTFCWNFGDGTDEVCGVDLTEVQHTYTDDGTYTLTLTVTDDDEETESSAQVEIANANIIVNAGDDTDGQEGQALSFTGAVEQPGNDVLTFCWNFGDGTDEVCGVDLTNPQHTYADDGTFTVQLSVTDEDGGLGADSLVADIANIAPTVSAGEDQSGPEGGSLTFTGSADDPGDDTLTFCWDFGDLSDEVCSLTPDPVSHTYAQDGTYDVTLRVFDEDGGQTLDTAQANVANVAPTLAFQSPSPQIDEGQSANFEATATDPGDDTLEVCWDFGDGTDEVCGGINLLSIGHTYIDDGTFTTTLRVSDNEATEEATIEVQVTNLAPRILGLPTVFIQPEEAPYIYSVDVLDAGVEDRITFFIEGPSGVELVDEQVVRWPEPIERTEPHTFTLRIEDGDGGVDVQTWDLYVGYTDLDNDGAPDACELLYPELDPENSNDGPLDFDGDGVTNAEECFQGTNPTIGDAPSPPRIESPRQNQTITERPVRLIVANSLEDGGRAIVYTFELFGDAALTDLIDAWVGEPEGQGTTEVEIADDDLEENKLYWWRARAFDGERLSAFTEPTRFRFSETPELPDIPEPIAPSGRLTTPEALSFIVGNPIDPERDPFDLEIEITPEGEDEPSHTLRVPPTPEAPTTTLPLPGNLNEDSTYHWRVRAVTANDEATDWSEALTFRLDLDNNIPDAPTPLSPAFGARVAGPTLSFVVRSVPDLDDEEGGLRYDMRLATTADFNEESLIAEATDLRAGPNGEVVWSLDALPEGMIEDATHHWDVRVRDREGLGDRGTSQFFFIGRDDPPGEVLLTVPGEGEVLRTQAPALSWQNPADPEGLRLRYDLEIATDESFAPTVYAQSGIPQQGNPGERTTWLGATLPDNTAYLWRVRAVDAAGNRGPWSTPGTFTVDRTDDAPPVPVPVSPRDGRVIEKGSPITLTWTTVDDPDGEPVSYLVELFDASGNKIDEGDKTNSPDVDEETHVPGVALEPGGYFWRVRASSGELQGPWSAPATFSVATDVIGDPATPRTPRLSNPLPSSCASVQSPRSVPMGGALGLAALLLGVCAVIRRRR